ncbi:MAG: hypothetical protein FWC80_04720 [Firmicutes bacterium]|nr:hypothetical protein [Bacillota bacterium]
MSNKSCCFLGNSKQLSYRQRDNVFQLFYAEVGRLIKDGYTNFIFSGNSDFESAARIAVISHRVKNSTITTTYITNPNDNIEQLQKAYDKVIIPDISKHTISQRNRYIVDNSDYCCFYVKNFVGDAFVAMLYAKKTNKSQINLAYL